MAKIGYGNIHPTGQLAKAVVILAVVFNLVFVGAIASAIATRFSYAAHGAQAHLATPTPTSP